MNYEITPQVGFGPIKFGMSSKEVRSILGQPTKISKSTINSMSDEDEKKYEANHHSEWYGQKYPDGSLPQVTYENDNVVLITIFKQSGPLIFKGMDLHKVKNRQEILEMLAATEEIYYSDDAEYFFPSSGLIVPIAKFAKRNFYIMLSLSSYMMPRLDYDMYEPSTALG